MKCKKCSEEKDIKEFEIANVINGKEYRRKICRTCKHTRQTERRKEIRKFFNDYMRTQSCAHCGNNDYRVLEYHHINPEIKEVTISNAIGTGWSRERILREIDKCIVLCANCHRILHYEFNGKTGIVVTGAS